MSYKDGIPLLTTFEDDAEDPDDYVMGSVSPPRKWKRRHILFGIVLIFAGVLLVGLAVSIGLGVTLKSSSSSDVKGEGTSTATPPFVSSVAPTPSPSHTAYSTTEVPSTAASSVPPAPSASYPPGSGSPSPAPSNVAPSTSSIPPAPSPSASNAAPSNSSSVPPASNPPAPSTSSMPPSPSSSAQAPPTSSMPPSPSSSAQAPPTSSMPPSPSSSAQAPPTSGKPPSPSSSAQAPPTSSNGSSASVPPSSTAPIQKSSSPAALRSLTAIPTGAPATPTPTEATPTKTTPMQMSTFSTASMAMSVTMNMTQELSPSPSPTTTAGPIGTSPSISGSVSPTPSPTPLAPVQGCDDDSSLCPGPRDNRTYDFDTLDNGLRVVVISDPSTDIAGASMIVGAGSFNDPPELEGLAHFCEHMLFLGTKTYPGKNDYSGYLSTHGGYDNAYTSTQETNYFFKVNAAYLNRSLDLFSHFFIDPLLSANASQSEMYAVNQEHEKNLHSDEWKLWQLLKNISNPKHPFSQFSTGNFETLNKSEIVVDALHEYYDNNYVANNMNLVVYGQEDTPELWDWVHQYFSPIKNNSVISVATYNETAFPPPYTGRLIHYLPEASTNVLTLFWQTPSLEQNIRNDVSDFLNRYLGNKGNGSLLYYLKAENYASDLSAGVEVPADSFYLFVLQITLTEQGLGSVSEVIQAVYQYAYLLANMSEAEFGEKWRDYVDVSKVVFDYAENESPEDYTKSITQVMRVTEHPADFLPNPRRYICNYDLTISTIQQLVPSNTIIFIGTQENHTSPETPTGIPIPVLNETEPIYGTRFHNVPIPDTLLSYWSYSQSLNRLDRDLSLASQDSFVPRNFSTFSPSDISTPQQNESNVSEVWFLQDTENFSQPLVNVRCELRSGNLETTAGWEASSRLFLALVTTLLEPVLYGATEVGYEYKLDATPRGFTLTFGGLSDRTIVERIISETISTLTNFEDEKVDPDLFDLTKSQTLDKLRNFNFTNLPFRYTVNYIQHVVMERPFWTNEQIIAEMEDLTLSSVLDFAHHKLLTQLSVTCLAHGHVDSDVAASYAEIVTDHLSSKLQTPPTAISGFQRERVMLDMSGDYGVSLPALIPDDDNSVVNVLYQAGPVCNVMMDGGVCSNDSILTSLHLSLLQQIIADECFTELRTTQKLGYVVFCFRRVRQGVGSFQVVVQSEEYSPEHVLDSVETFLKEFYHTSILNLTSSDFSAAVEILRQTLGRRDLALKDKTDLLWKQVLSGQRQFDFKAQQLGMLGSLSLDAFQEFYNQTIIAEDARHKLTLVVYGQGKDFVLPVQNLIDYSSLDQTNTTLPLCVDNPCA